MAVNANLGRTQSADHALGQADRQEGLPTALSWWDVLHSARDVQTLCQAWLNLLSSKFDSIQVGLVLLKNPSDGAYVPAAYWPDRLTDLSPLTVAAQQALMERRGVEMSSPPPVGAANGIVAQTHLAVPIEVEEDLKGVIVLGVLAGHKAELDAVRERLMWGGAWLTQFYFGERLRQSQASLEQAGQILDMALISLEKMDLQEAAMALVNELTVKLKLRRAGLGFLAKGEIHLQALSHTAHFQRQSEAVQVIERAMEEAFDQRRDLRFPLGQDSRHERFAVTSDHEHLVKHLGGGSVASFLISDQGKPFGVLTLESTREQVLGEDELALAEAFAKVAGPVLAQKKELDHWVTGKAKFKLKKELEKLLGPYHPALKLKAIAVTLAAMFLLLAEGEFRVSAQTVVEGLVQRSVVAPFQGYINQAPVRAGDTVSAGQTLATLEDKDLRLEQIRWQSEKEQSLRKYREAQAKHERAEASVLGAQLNQAEAQLSLIEEKLRRAIIRSPFDGIVVSGDLSQLLGAPVEQGKVLFEVTPLDAYRVILRVDERDIAYIKTGQAGRLVLSGLAGSKLDFSVKKITSVSTAEEGINYFRVEAQLDKPSSFIRPGMEGVGKIDAGRHKLAWIWTRRLTDWLKIKLWSWLP